VELAGLRAEVAFVQAEHGLSERRACKLLEVDRSSYDYESRRIATVSFVESLCNWLVRSHATAIAGCC
jgi:hypothetical protein